MDNQKTKKNYGYFEANVSFLGPVIMKGKLSQNLFNQESYLHKIIYISINHFGACSEQ